MVTFAKLKSGEWGVKGTADELVPGKTVSVKKQSGETKSVTVGKVVWSGNGTAMATIAGQASGSGTVTERQADAGYGRGRKVRTDCCGYPCPVSGRRCTPSDPCHDCQ